LVVEENRRKVNSRGEQDQRREVFDGGEVPWVTKKLAGDCSGWRMAREILPTVTRGDSGWLCRGDVISAKGFEEAR
jgi:hypothetical protein